MESPGVTDWQHHTGSKPIKDVFKPTILLLGLNQVSLKFVDLVHLCSNMLNNKTPMCGKVTFTLTKSRL